MGSRSKREFFASANFSQKRNVERFSRCPRPGPRLRPSPAPHRRTAYVQHDYSNQTATWLPCALEWAHSIKARTTTVYSNVLPCEWMQLRLSTMSPPNQAVLLYASPSCECHTVPTRAEEVSTPAHERVKRFLAQGSCCREQVEHPVQ